MTMTGAPVPPTIPDRDPGDETSSGVIVNLLITGGEPERIFAWRFAELERAGYTVLAAMRLAERPDVDLHRACELRKSGCPQKVALKILL